MYYSDLILFSKLGSIIRNGTIGEIVITFGRAIMSNYGCVQKELNYDVHVEFCDMARMHND